MKYVKYVLVALLLAGCVSSETKPDSKDLRQNGRQV